MVWLYVVLREANFLCYDVSIIDIKVSEILLIYNSRCKSFRTSATLEISSIYKGALIIYKKH